MAPLAELRRRIGAEAVGRGVPAARDHARGAGGCDAARPGPAPRHYDPTLKPGDEPAAHAARAARSRGRERREAGLPARAAPRAVRSMKRRRRSAGRRAAKRAATRPCRPSRASCSISTARCCSATARSAVTRCCPAPIEVLTTLRRSEHPVRRAHQRQCLSAGGAGREAAHRRAAGRGRPDAHAVQRHGGSHGRGRACGARWSSARAASGTRCAKRASRPCSPASRARAKSMPCMSAGIPTAA